MNLLTGISLGCVAAYSSYSLNYGRLESAKKKIITEDSLYFNKKIVDKIKHTLKDVISELEMENYNLNLLIIDDNYSSPHVYGNSLSKERGIIVPIQFCYNISNKEFAFLLKHEIAHINNSHLLKIPFYSFIAGCLPLVASSFYATHPAISISCSIISTLSTIILYTRATESEADECAIKSASQPEIQGGIATFNRERAIVKESRSYLQDTGNWRYLLCSEEGNNRKDFLHPPLSHRVAALKKALKT